VILVGDDPASSVYVRNKGNACEEVGFYTQKINKQNPPHFEKQELARVKNIVPCQIYQIPLSHNLGLNIAPCLTHIVLSIGFVFLRLVCPMLPVSLNYLSAIAPSVFSDIYCN
jgi:hypothetical protein